MDLVILVLEVQARLGVGRWTSWWRHCSSTCDLFIVLVYLSNKYKPQRTGHQSVRGNFGVVL